MKNSLLVSAAALGLLLAAQNGFAADTPKKEEAKAAMGECHGVNACKGKGQCGSEAGNACAGKNSCKGKGWENATEKDCSVKKGKWVAEKK
jgi:uncharacterized membrane protein